MEAIHTKVISLLEGLSARFPSMSFIYGYDATACQHLINVEPTSLYQSEAYMLAEADVYDAWDEVYPYDDLLFVSNNPHHSVHNPLHTIIGRIDVPIKTLSIEPIDKPLLVDSSKATHPATRSADIYGQLANNQQNVVFGQKAVQQVITINKGEVVAMEAGEYNYAMAA